MNFKILVIQFIFQGWSCELTKKLMFKHSYVDFINISADRSPFYPWFLSSMFNLLLRVIPKGFLNLKLLSYRASNRSILLYHKLKKLTNEFNFVIAHTPGAFHSAYNFASKNGMKCCECLVGNY
jgi:hypothetical protein